MALVTPKRITCIKGEYFQHNIQSAIKTIAKAKLIETQSSITKQALKR